MRSPAAQSNSSTSVSKAMHLAFRRVQFTIDLLPSDILGSEVLDERSRLVEALGKLVEDALDARRRGLACADGGDAEGRSEPGEEAERLAGELQLVLLLEQRPLHFLPVEMHP